ncbi:MAG: STAS domain-containing protein [Candidatus Ozemobacteraceae bacterium]
MAKVLHEGKEARIVFSGKLGLAGSEIIDAEVTEALLKEPESVVFDLAEVTFVASIFLRLCLKTFKKMGNGHFFIANASPAVKKIFVIAGLDGVMKAA